MAGVTNINEYKYRDFPWRPDPSPRDFEGKGHVYFSQRCAMNAIESLARVLAGAPLHPKLSTDGKGALFWSPQ